MESTPGQVANGQNELEALNEQERADLLVCEQTIGRGFQSFVEVGLALARVRDERLYRQEHYNFDCYCRNRWGISRIHAHRNIEAARVQRMLPDGNQPANEAQVRPLTRIRCEDGSLDQRAIVRVWRRVVDIAPADDTGRKVITANLVEQATRPVLDRRGIRVGSCTRRRRNIPTGPGDTTSDAGATSVSTISAENFATLHHHVHELDGLMMTESIPTSVRRVIESICDIVLG